MKYPKDAMDQYILPPCNRINDQLFARQGDFKQFLLDMAGEKAADQQQLSFEILFLMKAKENEEEFKKFQLLQQLHSQNQQMIMEANLLNQLASPNMAETKPEKILNILERLDPEKWGKRSVSRSGGKQQNPFEGILNE